MDAVFDFLRAALPWIAVGGFSAVFFARSAGKKKKGKEIDNYWTEGMCLGMCFGTAIGAAHGNNTGIGITLGVLLGLAVGTGIKKEGQNDNKKE